MTTSRFSPPLDYLQAASRASLQNFELTRLNHAANLRNEIAALMDQWITETSEALLARWMLDHHKSLQPSPMSPVDVARSLIDPGAVPFPDPQAPSAGIVAAPPRLAQPADESRTAPARKAQKQRPAAAG